MNLVYLCLQFPPNYHHLGALPRGAGPEWSVQVGDCAGQGAREDEAMADTRAMGDILKSKNVDAWIDFRDTDDNHDRPWRYRQMNYF